MTIEELKGQVRAVWRDTPAADLCIQILEYLGKGKPERLKMITFRDLVGATGKATVDSELLTAVAILTNSTFSVLDARALLVDEDETEHEISREEFAEARRTGSLIHPDSGKPVQDFEDHIIPFFVPSDRFLAEYHDR
jgi:hypothetical protein